MTVKIAKGKKNFYKLLKELPKPKKSVRTVKYNIEYSDKILGNYSYYKKKKIDIKELARVNKKTRPNLKKWLKIHRNWKKIPNTGVAISIRDDKAMLIALIKSNRLLLIKDKAYIKLMKELIDSYYKKAEKV